MKDLVSPLQVRTIALSGEIQISPSRVKIGGNLQNKDMREVMFDINEKMHQTVQQFPSALKVRKDIG